MGLDECRNHVHAGVTLTSIAWDKSHWGDEVQHASSGCTKGCTHWTPLECTCHWDGWKQTEDQAVRVVWFVLVRSQSSSQAMDSSKTRLQTHPTFLNSSQLVSQSADVVNHTPLGNPKTHRRDCLRPHWRTQDLFTPGKTHYSLHLIN